MNPALLTLLPWGHITPCACAHHSLPVLACANNLIDSLVAGQEVDDQTIAKFLDINEEDFNNQG